MCSCKYKLYTARWLDAALPAGVVTSFIFQGEEVRNPGHDGLNALNRERSNVGLCPPYRGIGLQENKNEINFFFRRWNQNFYNFTLSNELAWTFSGETFVQSKDNYIGWYFEWVNTTQSSMSLLVWHDEDLYRPAKASGNYV